MKSGKLIEVSAILKCFPPAARKTSYSFLVTLCKRAWHCQFRIPSDAIDDETMAMRFCVREKLIKRMKAAMELRDPRGFQHHYPKFGQRLNSKQEWRVNLRILEAQINQRLDAFRIAPVFIESWTRRRPSHPYFNYLPRSTLSVRMCSQMLEDAARLRWRFPARAGSCSCVKNKCVLEQCPCLTFKEEKSKGAVMLCGQTCGCDETCPSSYLKEERQIPLVLFHTHYKGWGVYTPVDIPAGTFLGLDAGHIVDVHDEVLSDNTTYLM